MAGRWKVYRRGWVLPSAPPGWLALAWSVLPSPRSPRPPETMVRKLDSPKKREPEALAEEVGGGGDDDAAGGLSSRAAVCFLVR